MEINQVSRPYNKMRYPTIGDYLYKLGNDRFSFIIAEMPTDYQALVFLHEFTEAFLCWKNGIKEEDITAFDKLFEEEREAGEHAPEDEPGDDERAPYWKYHQIATAHEVKYCKEIGVPWKEYNDYLNTLSKEDIKCK
jgi:hypothetical protein